MAALTVGARSRFNPHGEQGKKNTCQECHEKHVADLAAEAGLAEKTVLFFGVTLF